MKVADLLVQGLQVAEEPRRLPRGRRKQLHRLLRRPCAVSGKRLSAYERFKETQPAPQKSGFLLYGRQ